MLYNIFLKSIKILIILFPIIVVIFLGLRSFIEYENKDGIFATKEEKYFYTKLKEFKNSGKEKILLSDLTNFEWDEVIYLKPYSIIKNDFNNGTFKLNQNFSLFNEESHILFFLNKKVKLAYLIKIYPYESDSLGFFQKENTLLNIKGKKLNLINIGNCTVPSSHGSDFD